MALRVYNTLARRKETFEPLQAGIVSMYVCGPTVYNEAHVGHAMSAMVFDVIRRYLEYKGFQVKHVMNFTDVDDKIINRAAKLGKDPFTLAQEYIDDYRGNLEDLGILPATINPRATQEMPQIIKMIRELGENGHAYDVNGDVYFRVTTDADYGKLSGRKIVDMQAGSRIEVDERKENPMDFALWKSAKPGEPAWDSPWGKGRPGWHIECSAMNLSHLGEQIDIHGGGNDLVFPHHENEIAQTESLTGKTFARYWMHNGMVQLGGEKMSKSLGNLVTIKDFIKNHKPEVLRMMVLNSGYRNPLTYTDEVVTQAEKALDRLRSALRPSSTTTNATPQAYPALQTQVNQTIIGFTEAMEDDFNTAGALGHLFDLVRVINQARADNAPAEVLEPAQKTLRDLSGVFGLKLDLNAVTQSNPVEPLIELLIELRNEMRQQKLWAISDKIRIRLAELGVLLEDSKDGTTWRFKKST